MAYHFNDNVYTKSFTPREYQVELLDAAKQRNIIVCLGSSQGKIFIATKLIQELANCVRKPFPDGGKRSVYLVDSLPLLKQQASYIRHLTDLTVGEFTCFEEISDYNNQDWMNEFLNFQILVMTSEIFLHIIESGFLLLSDLNLIVLDECHKAIKDHPMRQIMKDYLKYEERPRVLGLTAPLLNGNCDPSRLEGELNRLEITLHSAAETASDIVSVLRYSARPKELVVECGPHTPGELDSLIEEQVEEAKTFLFDHRYDPSELYQDEFQEELQGIPDPKLDPYRILDDFLSILHTLGPWCADRAALALLIQLEKLKVKTPYERHFLLLCMISTVMVKIRAICDDFFRDYEEKERFYKFSSPKVIRLLQIIKHFKPENDPELLNLDGRRPCRNAFSQTDPSLFDTEPILLSNIRIFKNTEIMTISPLDNILNQFSDISNANLESEMNSELFSNENDPDDDDDDDESNRRLSSSPPMPMPMPAPEPEPEPVGPLVTDLGSQADAAPSPHVITPTTLLPQNAQTTLSDTNNQVDPFISTIPNLIAEEQISSSDNVISKRIIPKIDNNNKLDNIDDKAIRLELLKLILLNDDSNNGYLADHFLEEIELILQTNNEDFKNVEDSNNNETETEVKDENKIICKVFASVSTNTDPYDHAYGHALDYPFTGRRKENRRGGFGGGRYSRLDPSYRQHRSYLHEDADALCGIIFVNNKFTAKILFHLLNEIRKSDHDFSFLAARYTIDKTADPLTEPREAEAEHRKQEDVLKRFRMRECNLLIGTSVLEEGIDIPKCNLVIRFDVPTAYRSYVQSKGRARTHDALYVLMIERKQTEIFIKELAQYFEIEQMLLRKCANREPPEEEELEADQCTCLVETYRPEETTNNSSVNLASAVALLNRYCAKLPSDTFTRLTPIWTMDSYEMQGHHFYRCTLRLPINSPLKRSIMGAPMPTRVLARRIAALEACRALHEIRELDDNLLPVSKESFRLREEDESMWKLELDEVDEMDSKDPNEPRPGTTKRRQYYYKRIANALTDCRPIVGENTFLYHISMILTCPLPEEQNTRGRRLYPPEESPQGFGILTLKEIPKICPFPIFTRSGEVSVKLELSKSSIILTEEKIEKIVTFLNYTFTSVLRLQKYLMTFDPKASENSYFIVPTRKVDDLPAEVDWEFLEKIYENRDLKPQIIPEEVRQNFLFDSSKYHDAVIMPWYRNQDQPQYFYVAEICLHLNPKSTFPGSEYKTFDEYYFKKYNIQIQNSRQPLLDVDHTSARLNFLTPRYVNRKGVALPTSSEETKRAKRENLEQKQILVPELCTVHPFPASLWRKAVCLPCVLYRINALLLADQIRCQVADTIALGVQQLTTDFEWPPLDFGWSLAEVLKKSKENNNKNGEEKKTDENSNDKKKAKDCDAESEDEDEDEEEEEGKGEMQKNESKKEDWMEIGTWSNDMAQRAIEMPDPEDYTPGMGLPANLSLLGDEAELSQLGWGEGDLANRLQPSINSMNGVRYGSPTSWLSSALTRYDPDPYGYDSADDSCSDLVSEASDDIQGLRIEFKGENVAEAIEDERQTEERERRDAARRDVAQGAAQAAIAAAAGWEWDHDQLDQLDRNTEAYVEAFRKSTLENEKKILDSGLFISSNQEIILPPRKIKKQIKLNEKENLKLTPSTNTTTDNKELFDEPVDSSENKKQNRKDLIIVHSPKKFASLQNSNTNGLRNISPKKEKVHLTNGFHLLVESPMKKNPNTEMILNKNGIVKGKTPEHEEVAICKSPDAMLTQLVQLGLQVHANNKFSIILSYENLLENHNYLCYDLDEDSDELDSTSSFSFDSQPELEGHPGPSPSVILQALTMSNANDGINLERLETIGDSFLKYAITTYLYCTYDNIHEGKLSHLRSKQVSNLNLYRLGRRKIFGESMIASKFEPHDNWLPPCYYVPKELEQALIEHGVPASHWNQAELPALKAMTREEICQLVRARGDQLRAESPDDFALESLPCFIPYNLITQHSIPDKSVADCVEALIGAYLISCGPRGALLFMAWLGICVLPREVVAVNQDDERPVGCLVPDPETRIQVRYGRLSSPRSPLLRHVACPENELGRLLDGYDAFERRIRYHFQDRSYLLQALTHASYSPNQLTDCYQRLEFLGDAVLDYLITRHLYEDLRQHSPGALTDLRSALVNNTIFASLAVRYGFHKYFRHLSPGLSDVVDRFVRIQEENGHTISEEYYLIEEEECEEAEDVEVPKALGDVFESVAGAIFLDSGMSLDAVWRVYHRMMRQEIEQFSTNVPKSPIRDLLELEPETAKFGKPEKLADGRRVRVTVEVFGKGSYKGIGRNYRIAKCTAAKCALKQLKKKGLLSKKS